jgi:hypothetical protein
VSFLQAKHQLCCLVFVWAVLAGLGCRQGTVVSTGTEQGVDPELENRRLASSIKRLEQDKEQLEQQVNTLAGLPETVDAAQFFRLRDVKLTKRTGLYDKDKDGSCEKLIVYIKPLDQDGDVIKAAARVDVQLWDLNADGAEALLSTWAVEPEQLRKMWFSTMLSINYRLMFDLPEKAVSLQGPLTVKVVFTDLLSGVVFNQHALVKKH